MSDVQTHVIINPASAGGKTGKMMHDILQIIGRVFGESVSLFITGSPFQASASAADAVRNGSTLVIAIGGDGTLQEVINGLFLNGHLINPECHLGIVCNGTGRGFAQSIGLPSSIEQQIELIRGGRSRAVDVGKVTFRTLTGEPSHRYFINECQMGIGGAVVQRVQQNHKRLGGTIAFGIGTVETALRHRNQSMTIAANGDTTMADKFTGVVVANGSYTGGGMNLAPGARVDDGRLDVLLMHNLSIVQRLSVFPKIYSGSHVHSKLFTYFKASSLTVDSGERVLVEADGELLGTTPCSVQISPSPLLIRF